LTPHGRHDVDITDPVGGLTEKLDVFGARQQLFEHHPDLTPGQIGTQALVHAVPAKADVWVGATGDIKAERVMPCAFG
jgi:hypothetical protein